MKRLAQQWDQFWFYESSPKSLAILRVLVGLYSIWYITQRVGKFVGIAAKTDSAFFSPVGIAALLGQPIPAEVYRSAIVFTIWLGVMFVMGCWYRVVGPLFAVCLLLVLCYRNSWSMVHHSDNLLVIQVLILGLTRSADAWSMDSWLLRASPDAISRHKEKSWRYGWPIRLICAVTTVTYFLAGVAKVAGPLGWSWASGQAMRGQVATDALRKELLGNGASPFVSLIYDHIWLFTILGVTTLVFELGAPLVVFNRRLGRLWASGIFLMHWGIYFLMGIKFRFCLSGVAFAAFFCIEGLKKSPAKANTIPRSAPSSVSNGISRIS